MQTPKRVAGGWDTNQNGHKEWAVRTANDIHPGILANVLGMLRVFTHRL